MLTFLVEIRRELLFLSLFILAGGIGYIKLKKYDPVMIEDIVDTIRQTFIPVSLAFCVTVAALCGITYKTNKKLKPSVTLKLQYENASSGKNTDGTRFNENDLISEDVFKSVLESGKYDLSLDDMSHLFTIGSSYDNSSVSETDPKVATEYHITYTADILNYDIDSKQLMEDIGNAAKEYLISTHGENTSVLSVNLDGISDLDYEEAGDKLSIEAEKIRRYMSNYQWSEQTFSDDNEQTFASLTKKVDNYIDTEITQYQSYIQENGVTKNKEQYKTLTSYKNKILQVSKDKHQVVYDVNLSAIKKYDSSMTSVVLVPTDDKSGEFYMSRTKIGVDYFAANAESETSEMETLTKQMETNTYIADKVSFSTAGKTEYAKADSMLESLQETLASLSEDAESMFAAYQDQKYGGYITVSMNDIGFTTLTSIKNNIVAAVAFIFAILYSLAVLKKVRDNENVH